MSYLIRILTKIKRDYDTAPAISGSLGGPLAKVEDPARHQEFKRQMRERLSAEH